jgi:subtilisin family serine protease
MGIDKVADLYKGDGITIAFLDTGISFEFKQKYASRIVSPINLLNNSNDVEDKNGHGTKIITLATGNKNEINYLGVAPNAKIIPIVIADKNGTTTPKLISDGIYYAVQNGADIINISLGSELDSDLIKQACDFAYEMKVLLVSSCGDNGRDKVLFPARYSNVIGIQSQSKTGAIYNKASTGEGVNFLVPGEQIFTCSDQINKYHLSNGSSYSSEIFTGICALLLQKNNNFDLVYDLLMNYTYSTTFLDVPALLDVL